MCHSCLKSCNLHVSRALTGSACCPGSPVLSASTGWAFRHHRECQGQDPGQGGWVSLADYFYSITLCIKGQEAFFILKQVNVGGWAATKLPVYLKTRDELRVCRETQTARNKNSSEILCELSGVIGQTTDRSRSPWGRWSSYRCILRVRKHHYGVYGAHLQEHKCQITRTNWCLNVSETSCGTNRSAAV